MKNMDRQTYWLLTAIYLGATFALGYMDGYLYEATGSGGPFPGLVALATTFSLPFFWTIGYWRLKDAGQHGGWAVFAPIVIAMIWIGCLRTETKEIFE